MKLVLNPIALLLAAVICFITTMVSANRPAGRAIRISPIESVRQSEDVNIKAREVKTSKLTQKLFGFEGMLASKNFKRNRRRYRSVVLSLFMSVVLFISASSFCSYLTAAVSDRTGYNLRSRMDVVYTYVEADESPMSADETMKLLSGVPGVKNVMTLSQVYDYIGFREDMLSAEMDMPEIQQYFDGWVKAPGYKTMDTQIFIVDDRMFADFCSSAGADVKDFTDKNGPKVLFVNQRNFYLARKTVDVFSESSLPVSCSIVNVKEIDGYHFRDSEETEDGGLVYVYYPQEYMNDFWDGKVSELDPEMSLRLTPEEAVSYIDVTIGAFAGEDAVSLFGPNGCLIVPYSTAEAVFGSEKAKDYTSAKEMLFQVENHTAAFDAMKTILSEKGMNTDRLIDYAEDYEGMKMMVTVINVFSYGFIILISLIALANVFNTISTNVILRRREFAMLKSVGMDSRGFNKMMNYECIIYGVKGLSLGIPVSILTTFLIFQVAKGAGDGLKFFIPFGSFAVAIGSVFIVVFATMIFAMNKIKKDNPIDALKNENI
ncbi:MAG: ABC transporter permease [Firmicutes bacterium]|nr:ABC transporter permease [Bacillota bacterium]MBR0481115.1 ABC transporter permease [Bacillota bacterium]